MPISEYEAKKTVCIRNRVGKIHACPYDCILYRKEFLEANRCSMCKYSRWMLDSSGKDRKGILAKNLLYIPPIQRLKRLFQNYGHAKNLVWHEEGRIKDGKLQHVADALAWNHIDDT